MKTTLTFAAAGTWLILSSVLFARPPGEHPAPPTFEEVDADGDQMITREELEAYMEERRAEHERRMEEHAKQFNPFGRADRDEDGVLNEEEFNEMIEHMRQRHMHMRDEWGASSTEQ
ncbi:MAG TPA: EF-hand domain-containing protein [Woeseiaceae bacterium]|jgi:hypothetical protein|nr:EF-hand domain-containing protein [Woeseiaceae bacterium]